VRACSQEEGAASEAISAWRSGERRRFVSRGVPHAQPPAGSSVGTHRRAVVQRERNYEVYVKVRTGRLAVAASLDQRRTLSVPPPISATVTLVPASAFSAAASSVTS
jgi:hypothetical protein